MPRAPKSWAQKLADARAKHGDAARRQCDKTGEWFVVPGVCELEAMVRQVPAGKLLAVAQITDSVARRHRVDFACPMTTGIFLWIMAHASAEAAEGGAPEALPWWRVVKAGGELNPKYPGDGAVQRARLETEGHRVEMRGRRLVVAGFERTLVDVPDE